MMTAETRALAEQADAIRAVIAWAEHLCPCKEGRPDPCTLCGATADEWCRAADTTFPKSLLIQMRAALDAGAAAVLAQDWQPIESAPKHTPLLFLFDEGDGSYFQEVGQRLDDAPNGGRMRFAEANMNPGNEPEETTQPCKWMPLPRVPQERS